MVERVMGPLEKELDEKIGVLSLKLGFEIGKVDGGYWRGCYRTSFQVGKYVVLVSQTNATNWTMFVTRLEKGENVLVMMAYMTIGDFEEKFNIVVAGCAAQGR